MKQPPSGNIAVTAIVTAFMRFEQTVVTLERIRACRPCPNEIVVHVDFGGDECCEALRRIFNDIHILSSNERVGPGGARNKLIAAASNEIVASFDDDSYPIDSDYFARLLGLFTAYPDAAVISSEIFSRNECVRPPDSTIIQVSSFGGGACAYQRSAFLQVQGYLPIPVAYGMEEVDVALQLHARGHRVLKSAGLRVFHDTDYCRHASSSVVSGTIANAALLAYLRYPVGYWPRGLLQVLSNACFAFRNQRYHGICNGLLMIPRYIYQHRQYRNTVNYAALRSYLALRRHPQRVHIA